MKNMQFYENQLFHICNQGNNKRQIYFSDDNYEFFLWKMRAYLLPFGDLVAYCLMPNHYHWQFFVRKITVERKVLRVHIDKVELQRRIYKYGDKAQPVNHARTRTAKENKGIALNDAIGDLQKGYAQAINKERNWTGSLFRTPFKAKDGWINEFVTVDKKGKNDFRFLPGNDYSYKCLEYIHRNPVKAKLVKNTTDYRWSSAKEYAGIRNGSLCNFELGREIINFM